MSFTSRPRMLLGMLVNDKDLKVFLIHILISTLLQILARRCLKYIKDHPELLEKTNKKGKKANPRNKNKNPLIVPRGGAFVVPPQVFAFIKYLNDTGILKWIAESGIGASLTAGGTVYMIKKIPLNAISNYIRNAPREALPATHGYIEKSLTTVNEVGKLTLPQCEGINELEYLFYVLKDSEIPFEERKRLTISILTRFLNLSTDESRRNSLLCLLAILCALAIYNPSSYYILFQALLKAVEEGKIPKNLIRWIIRNLKKDGRFLNPELLYVIKE